MGTSGEPASPETEGFFGAEGLLTAGLFPAGGLAASLIFITSLSFPRRKTTCVGLMACTSQPPIL